MDWFERHLNWTWVIIVGVAAPLLGAFPILLFIVIQLVNSATIDAKNRSMWWLFPSFVIFFLPLLLRNKTIKEVPTTVIDENKQ
jgi:uncharacterized membrane protein YadS